MQRPGFLAALTASALAPALVLPPGRAEAADDVRAKLVPGQRPRV